MKNDALPLYLKLSERKDKTMNAKKIRKVRIASVIMAAMLAAGGSVSNSYADIYDLPENSRWTIFVAGTDVVRLDNGEYVKGVTYDWDSDILTLNNFNYEGSNYFVTDSSIDSSYDTGNYDDEYDDEEIRDYEDDSDSDEHDDEYTSDEDMQDSSPLRVSGVIHRFGNLTIELKGENHITVNDESVPSGFVAASPVNVNGNVTYLGSGSLEITDDLSGTTRTIYGSDSSNYDSTDYTNDFIGRDDNSDCISNATDLDSDVEANNPDNSSDTYYTSSDIEDNTLTASGYAPVSTYGDLSSGDNGITSSVGESEVTNPDMYREVRNATDVGGVTGNLQGKDNNSTCESFPVTGEEANLSFMLIALGASLAGILAYICSYAFGLLQQEYLLD